MKVAVIGSRNYTDYVGLSQILKEHNITEIISGGAKGADTLAANFAIENSIGLTVHKADWKKYGRAAGPIRNTKIINSADKVIAFWDGKSKGTKDSIKKAEKQKKQVIIIEYST